MKITREKSKCRYLGLHGSSHHVVGNLVVLFSLERREQIHLLVERLILTQNYTFRQLSTLKNCVTIQNAQKTCSIHLQFCKSR